MKRDGQSQGGQGVEAPRENPTGLSGDEATDYDPTELLRRQAGLLAFVESISSELELRPLLDRILIHACHLIGADDGTIGLVDPQQGLVRMEAAYRMSPEEIGSEYLMGVGLAGRVLQLGEPVVLGRYSELPAPVAERDNAVIGLPIRWRDEMIGFFGIGRVVGPNGEPAEPFSRADVATLEVFARHAAIAIENARRYLREQERGERLELIAEIGTIITAKFEFEEMLQSAAEAIHDLLGYPNVGIGVVHEGEPATVVIEAMAGEYKDKIPSRFVLPLGTGIMGTCAAERRTIRVADVHKDPRYVPAPGVKGIQCLLSIPIIAADEVLGVLNVESDDPIEEEDAQGLQIVADQLAVAMQNAKLYVQAKEGAALRERQRIARDLHDSVTQHLFGTVMVAESLSDAWERDAEQGKERVSRVLELARAALGEMRALLAEVRTSGPAPNPRAANVSGIQRLRAYGLPESLARLANDMADLGLRVELHVDDYTRQEFALEEALYRITQEALNNAAKHAGASLVTVHLSHAGSGFTLNVADDGCGMDPAHLEQLRTNGSGMGLSSMKERVAALGGRIGFVTDVGQGVRVEVEVPDSRSKA